MNKADLIERIIDTFTDMGSEDPEDTAFANRLTLPEAKLYLNELRENEKLSLPPDEWLPNEITPELYMEAFNCYLAKCQYDITLKRLVEFFTIGEVCNPYNTLKAYHEFDGIYKSETDKIVYPTDYLNECIEFPFTSEDLTMFDLIVIGQNSPDFDPNEKFCWYDEQYNQLHTTDIPFSDDLIDANAFAEWILADHERTQCIMDNYMINTDIDYIFRYWRK